MTAQATASMQSFLLQHICHGRGGPFSDLDLGNLDQLWSACDLDC